MSDPQPEGHLIVVGSSAGGIEALSRLVATLPTDIPAPTVIAQHLDPSRPSHLASILERRSTLPIVTVEDQIALEPGKVYVVPANRHVAVTDGHLSLETEHPDRPRPSIDVLLSTAAEVYGERLVAVILTGTGSDGAAGAVTVKERGGTVVIQNPASARFPGMPLALPPTIVDHVVELERIGPLLDNLVRRVPAPRDDADERTFQAILALVAQRADLDFTSYKRSTLLRRIQRRMALTYSHTLREYLDFLEGHPAEVGELVMALLIKVTEFFRDPEAFKFLRDEILPLLVESGRQRGRVLRFWSAGCATGEEPYSLAFLVADLLGPELNDWSVKIFATDVDEATIAFARRGLYPGNTLDQLPPEYRNRYFEPVEQGFRVQKNLRQLIIFGHQDLARGIPFPRIDLVVCRNLLIYFKPELQQEVLDLFAYSLHTTRGFLFLGKAETARPSKATFELVNKRWKLYQAASAPLPGVTARGNGRPATPSAQPLIERFQPREMPHPTAPTEGVESAVLRPESLLRLLPIGVAVIDREYRIHTINPMARRLLGIRELAAEQDFLHSLRGLPYGDVRTAIDTAFRERSTVNLDEVEVAASAGGEARFLAVSVALLPGDGRELAQVSVVDVTTAVESRRRIEAVESEQRQLVQDLSQANKRLTDMNKELQDANEELQAANEELMLAHEELQATNEEFEATNEELQATNEELETNNEELQATNEELETTNEELNARTHDLQDLTRSLSLERLRLSEIVDLAPLSILVLRGHELRIESCSPKLTAVLGGDRAGVGRRLEDLAGELPVDVLVPLVRRAFDEDQVAVSPNVPVRVHGAAHAGERTFGFTAVPSHDNAGEVDGVLLYGEDLTEETQRQAAEQREKLRLMIEHLQPLAIALFDAETHRLVEASAGWLDLAARLHALDRHRILGRTWGELVPQRAPEPLLDLPGILAAGPGTRRFGEVRLTDAAGGELAVDLSVTVVERQPSQPPPYVILTALDVTPQARARDERDRLDHLKDEFLSLASHELRTPLVPLTTYAELLDRAIAAEKSELGIQVREYVGKFRRQLDHLTRMIDDLTDVARLESGGLRLSLADVDLGGVVGQAVEEVRAGEPTAKVQLDAADGVAVRGDADRLVQVFANLVRNAVRHGGRRAVQVRLASADGTARIEVADRGPGIAPEHLDRIFTRFFQTERGRKAREGMGLGLYIARGLVEQHGGRIGVESNVGEGSTFWVELPTIAKAGAETAGVVEA